MDLSRSSGILLHISSLPSAYGIGDLGPAAYAFADFLAASRQQYWQVLPLVPTGLGHSPYSSPSTFASNPLFISVDNLNELGLVSQDDVMAQRTPAADQVDFHNLIPARERLLSLAFDNFERGHGSVDRDAFERYSQTNADWLDDYAEFMTLRSAFESRSWTDWPAEFAQRHNDAMQALRRDRATDIRRQKFWQFLFHVQWTRLKAYCNERHIRIFGDLPIYVAHDSADVWANPELFHLNEHGHASLVAGVPPDYFSETGQRWGNPIYRWEVMQQNDYAWWYQRLKRVLERVDLLRLDHFRGFDAYWAIDGREPTAVNGQWLDAPGEHFFSRMRDRLGRLPVVAEDLGIITDGVRELMRRFGFPGMAVMQFGYESDPDSTFLPHNFIRELIAYTGTHDNDTLTGWWQTHASTQSSDEFNRARDYARRYLDLRPDDDFARQSIRALWSSVADVAIIPVQDLIGLGSSARMNTPGTAEGNWGWRLLPDQLTHDHAEYLRSITEIYGRAPRRP